MPVYTLKPGTKPPDECIPLNGIVVITTHTTAVTNTNRYAKVYSSNLFVCIKYTCADVCVKL